MFLTLKDIVEKTGINENDIWLAFNDLNIELLILDNGEQAWQLETFNEVPLLVTLILLQNM